MAVVGDVGRFLQDGRLVSQCEVQMRFLNVNLSNRVKVSLLIQLWFRCNLLVTVVH